MVKTWYLSFMASAVVISLSFGLQQVHADDANEISIQNISVQPNAVKVGGSFTMTATLVNNSTVPIFVSDMISKDCQGPFFTVSFDNHVKVAITAKDGITCSYVGHQERLDPGKKYTGTSPGLSFTYTATESGTANVTVTFPYAVKNQTDSTQPNIEHVISKSLLFVISDNNTSILIPHHGGPRVSSILTPLKQFKSGISAKDVTCWQGLQLIFKFEDSSPACVKSQTAQTLVEHGWGMWVPAVTEQNIPILSNSVKVNNTDFTIHYDITGGKVEMANADLSTNALIISIKTTGDGMLTVDLPRGLIDMQENGHDVKFNIQADGQVINFKEINTTNTDRILAIPFYANTQQIKFIGSPIP